MLQCSATCILGRIFGPIQAAGRTWERVGTGAPRPARRRAPISSGRVVVHAVDRGVGGPGAGQLREQKATPGLRLQDLGWVLPSAPEPRPVGHLAAALGLLGLRSGKTKAAARAEAPCGVRPRQRALEELSVQASWQRNWCPGMAVGFGAPEGSQHLQGKSTPEVKVFWAPGELLQGGQTTTSGGLCPQCSTGGWTAAPSSYNTL
ncbi:uncharacterized protein LOC132026067 [Mustela nigripes]|uniref:uncharacterized protein LOC132026067 n=1 Tax=Mustela nigripes TaxID=77151 RepID=UPI00281502E2|nr:uncharacterized protein LOC132026067 [Mustela nigripes]